MEELIGDRKPFIVIYDHNCPVCRNLAAFAEARGQGIKFMAISSFEENYPGVLEGMAINTQEKLVAWDGLSFTVGTEAWAKVIENYPDLRGLSWLAAKLGLSLPMARLFEVSGLFLRGFCKKCPNEKKSSIPSTKTLG